MRTSLATLLVISAVCSTGWSQTAPAAKSAPATKPAATTAATPAAATAVGPTAVIDTTAGKLTCALFPDKAPIGVARAAARAGVPVVAVAGRLQLSPQRLHKAGISAAYALSDLEPDASRSIANASTLLRQLGAKIARDWLVSAGQMDPSKRV